MIIKTIAVIICIIALIMTFKVKWVLETFFKTKEPSLETQLKVKYIALALAAAAFIAVFVLAR